MKKISLIFAGLAALSLTTFTSCVQDTNPKISAPTEFVLNTPPMGENTLYLNNEATLNLSWSQPNYGLGIVADYVIEVSGNESFTDAEGNPSFDYICAAGSEEANVYNNCKVDITGQELGLALMRYYGWEDEDTMDQSARQVWLRVRATVPDYEQGTIVSNAVAVNVVPYFVVLGPDSIYLVGQPNGWDINGEGMALVETEPGSKIYKGTYTIEAGKFQFRFYDKLGDWEHYSIGAQDADSPVEITMTDGLYEGPVFYDPDTEAAGKGSWQISDWAGGSVSMTVDLKAMTVEFKVASEPDQIYLVGQPNGWDINSKAMPLTETAIGSRVYEATYNINADEPFRFYSELGDWETNSIGWGPDDADLDITLPYDAQCMSGKGKWKITGFAGEVHMVVDLVNNTVSFSAAE